MLSLSLLKLWNWVFIFQEMRPELVNILRSLINSTSSKMKKKKYGLIRYQRTTLSEILSS